MPDTRGLTERRIRHLVATAARVLTIPWRQHVFAPARVSSVFGCSFGCGGWQHLVRTLEEFRADPAIGWRSTTLAAFHRAFCPRNVFDVVGRDVDAPPFVFPWGPFSVGFRRKEVLSSRFCGPSTDDFIRDEFERLIRLYERIRSTGYRPWSFGHGFLYGTILVDRTGARRFVVLQGNHRMAALAVLGAEAVSVRTDPRRLLAVVREEECERWPLVQSQVCSVSDAIAVFRMFFEQNGLHVLRRMEGEVGCWGGVRRASDLRPPMRAPRSPWG